MTKLKIALCLIAKDREKQILRALESTKGIFDLYCLQDTGSTDKTVEVFEEWCKKNNREFKSSRKFIGKDYKFVEVNGKKILGDFGKAREDSFNMAKQAKCDYAFWLDTDDTLNNPDLIHRMADNLNQNGVHMALLPYIYAKAINGLNPVIQKRERLIDIRIKGHWIDRVHEGYILEVPAVIASFEEISIQHERGSEEVLETGRRNHLIMESQLAEEGIEKFSDKMLQNLAYDHWEHKEHQDAIKYYKILLKRIKDKKFKDLEFSILMKLAKSFMEIGELDKAISYSMRASDLSAFADPFIIISECLMRQGKWEDAIFYADKILRIGLPQTTNPINELDYTLLPRQVKVNCLMNVGRFDEAKKISQEISQLMPTRESDMIESEIDDQIKLSSAIMGVVNLLRYYQNTNSMKYANRIKNAVPLALRENPTVRNIIYETMTDYKRKAFNIKLSGKKSIIFYSGHMAIEEWNGRSDVEKGIGGSEGMTIQLARELVKLGNNVIVYNDIKEDGVYDGVHYINAQKWNADMKCDVFISVRRPDIFAKIIKAKKQYLWLHDTGYGKIPKSFFYSPNKILVLSEAHRDVIKQEHHLTDDSIFHITRNALNPLSIDFADKNKGKRNPYQLIYASSYDRGLDFILENWDQVKKEVPEATLKIFYGWNTFDALAQARRAENMMKFKSYIIGLIAKTEGVQELGRISQNELYKEFAESSIWFYPSTFYEISCITAMSAQATGCIPVCTPYAALNETVNNNYGVKLNREEIVEGLIYTLKHIKEKELIRDEMQLWARDKFDMVKLAKEWDLFFNED